MKRFISALLSFVMAISLLAYLPIQVEAYEEVKSNVYTDWDLVGGNGDNQFNARKYLKENGTFNYHAWSQGQLPWGLYQLGNKNVYASFNNAGCLVTAFAKIAVQSGNYSVYNMDPGIMNELMQRNGCFQAGNGICNSYANTAKLIGLTYDKNNQVSYSKIVSELKADNSKQFILYVTTSSGDPHYVPVNNELTIKYGKVYVDNSGREGGRTESESFAIAQKKYSTGKFNSYQQYESELVGKTPEQLGFTVRTVYMFTGLPSKVTINFHSNNTVGKTGDTWLYPAFKIQTPSYINSKITTVGYTVKTESGKEIYKFEETYNKGVNKDGEPYTYFGDRTDGKANMDLEKDIYNVKREYLTDIRIEPGQKYKVKGFVIYDGKRYESSEYTMSTTGTKINVTIESYKTSKVGITGDNWLYPAFKVTVPNYRNSGITTVGYTVYTASGTEMFRFQETYKSGVNQDGTSYKNTFFGARTDGGANMDLADDIYDVSREYLTDARFIPGHSYKVKGFVVFDGKRYESPEYGFATTGTKQCTWNSGKVTKQPTCTATGVRTYTCPTCGGTKTESIPVEDHRWNSGSVTKQPTCTATGVKTFTCSSCGETKTESIAIDPKGHTPGLAANCTSPQKCTDCGTQLKPALGHNYSGSYWYSTHPHEEYQKCTRCNAEKKTGNTQKVDGCSICYPTFTITYNANGGSGAPASQTKTSGKALTLSSTKPTKPGYTFLGWATSSSASSAQYNPGGSFTTDANTTLYAVWRKDTPSVAKFTNVSASKGSKVILEFVVEQKIEVSALMLGDIEYDKSVLTLDYSNIEICPSTFVQNSDPDTGIMIGFSPSSAVVGTVFKIPFIISSLATDGEYTVSGKLQYQVSGVQGLIDAETKSGSINIISVKRGDVNGDGLVNADDAIHLMWYTFRPERYPVTKQSHDYNGDGMTNADDAIYLMWNTFRPDRYPLY